MAEESKTFMGMMGNLADQWARFRNLVMASGLFDFLKGRLGEALSWAAGKLGGRLALGVAWDGGRRVAGVAPDGDGAGSGERPALVGRVVFDDGYRVFR